ncbi:hypothetical protein [Prescottella equi]|uniref:hypothetical protein n=1 Tax=Rhodococcus hoagii TaxID=43767 RepID=UPI0007CD406B|nr:hypothetical protein [Prescottella equi]
MTLPTPQLDLTEPGTVFFTAERALRGERINRLGQGLRNIDRRSEFRLDPASYLDALGLTDIEREAVLAKRWSDLLVMGGHIHLLLKIAAAFGEDLFDIGGENVGVPRAEIFGACPRTVDALPEGVESWPN